VGEPRVPQRRRGRRLSALADQVRSFDRVAVDYEQARPTYPPGMLDLLPLGTGAEVLDLGAGTGKLTRLLVERYARVFAVEPLDGMRAVLERVVPEAEALAGAAESIPLRDASVDGVFAGQAFHWFANDAAVGEIARVLRPGGVICVVWNWPREESPLPEAYREYLDRLHAPSLERFRSEPSTEEVLGRGPFGEPREAAVDHEQVQDRDDVLALARSVSWIANRPEEERARIMRELDALLPDGPFVVPLRANVTWAERT
jgi:ubiquinone/menaquinone biosynthesis C-methylase UbiE